MRCLGRRQSHEAGQSKLTDNEWNVHCLLIVLKVAEKLFPILISHDFAIAELISIVSMEN